MKGDYYRYIAEFKTDAPKRAAVDNATNAYEEAFKVANARLPVTHQIRMSLASNYAVFHYEFLGNREEACRIARDAFSQAAAALDGLQEDDYKNAMLMLSLLNGNLL